MVPAPMPAVHWGVSQYRIKKELLAPDKYRFQSVFYLKSIAVKR